MRSAKCRTRTELFPLESLRRWFSITPPHETGVPLSAVACQTCCGPRLSSPARLLLLVRLSQRRIEARLAHAACLATLALSEAVAAGMALEFLPTMSVRLLVGVDGDSLRPAADALLAEDFLALHAHTGHERPRMGRTNRVGLAIAAETTNGSENARGQTTATIRVAIAAS